VIDTVAVCSGQADSSSYDPADPETDKFDGTRVEGGDSGHQEPTRAKATAQEKCRGREISNKLCALLSPNITRGRQAPYYKMAESRCVRKGDRSTLFLFLL
jgi:hypothetical protein